MSIQFSTSGRIAAFLAEPIQGVGGFITPPKEYFKIAFNIVKQYGGDFISDEVQTAWGRTGHKWFGIEHWEVDPDMITSAKGLGNGVPIGLTIAKPEIADSFQGLTISTFGGNPVTCVTAKAVIDVIEEDDLRTNAAVVGGYFRKRLEAVAGETSADWRCARHGPDAGVGTGRRSHHQATVRQGDERGDGRSAQTRPADRQRRVLRQRASHVPAAEHFEGRRGRSGENSGRELHSVAGARLKRKSACRRDRVSGNEWRPCNRRPRRRRLRTHQCDSSAAGAASDRVHLYRPWWASQADG